VLVRLAQRADAAAIADIYNQGIADRVATFEVRLRTTAQLEEKLADLRYPVVVADEGRVLGWAGLSEYSPRECYRGVADFSVYLDRSARGRGLGKRLLEALLTEASRAGFWKVTSRVFVKNAVSRALCSSCGFREVGVHHKHAQLDGEWLDVVTVERLIPENQR
jgi:phosphinothricin acetyltransferase